MLIEIRNCFTGNVVFSQDVEDNTILKTLVAAVEQGAYLRGAYLRGADLQGADLQGADLRGADLQGADLQGAYLQGADLRGADLQGAYLQGADLRGADLQGADLQGAYLRGAYLQGAYEDALEKNPIFINNLYWLITITTKHLTIGCQHHTIEAWQGFTDVEIANMDSYASEFWKVWKLPLLAMAEAHRK